MGKMGKMGKINPWKITVKEFLRGPSKACVKKAKKELKEAKKQTPLARLFLDLNKNVQGVNSWTILGTIFLFLQIQETHL